MKLKTYVKMLAKDISDKKLSMLLSECAVGHIGHTSFGDREFADEPCCACLFDTLNDLHTLPPDCVETAPHDYHECSPLELLCYLENNLRGT